MLGALHGWVQTIDVDASDNVVVAGWYEQAPSVWSLPDAGVTADGFVAKLEPSGGLLWSDAFGNDTGPVMPFSVAVDAAGNVSVGGLFEGTIDLGGGPLTAASPDPFAARFGAAGTLVWSTRWDTQSGPAWVAATAAGGTRVTGAMVGATIIGGKALTTVNDSSDLLLAEFEPGGALLDASLYGDAQIQRADAMALDSFEQTVIAGNFYGTLDLGFASLTAPFSGGFYIAKLPK